MASLIDPTKPTDAVLYTGDLRANLSAAKTEIEALQAPLAFKVARGTAPTARSLASGAGTITLSSARFDITGTAASGFDLTIANGTTLGETVEIHVGSVTLGANTVRLMDAAGSPNIVVGSIRANRVYTVMWDGSTWIRSGTAVRNSDPAAMTDLDFSVVNDTTPELGGTLDGNGNAIVDYTKPHLAAVSGPLTQAAHGGRPVLITGPVTVPVTNGFICHVKNKSGSSHTVGPEGGSLIHEGVKLTALATISLPTNRSVVVESDGTDVWVYGALTPSGSGGSSHGIMDEGVVLPARTYLRLTGAGVSASDDEANDRTNVTIPGGEISNIFVSVTDHGATGNGTTDDRAAFVAAFAAGAGVTVPPGTYRIASNLTVTDHLYFVPGAMLSPDSGVTVSWAAGASITAGDYQIFAPATGGLFNGVNMASWARSSWFPGTTSGSRDLGLQLHNAMQWGFLQIDVPPAADHVIRTTVRLLHGATIRCMWHGFPRHVICATNDKPVFEAVGPVRHWRIIGGVFDGAAVDTPSCFLLCGRDNATAGQCGDTTALSETHVTGNWGVGVVVSISSEVLVFSNCNLWIQGTGDSTWAGNNSTITIANADYWNVPFTYTQPNQVASSCSAVVFQNCDIRGGVADAGMVFYLKGQVEDVSITATYLNAVGRCHILCEPGQVGAGSWTSPRRLYLGGGGRTENNKGIAWNGVPTIIIDGINVAGAGLYILNLGAMGHFVGGQANSTPIIKTERGGQLYSFTMTEASWIDSTDVLLEHTTADLNWANIWHPWPVDINCTGRTLHNCDIKIGGDVLGTIGATTTVRAANVNNWPVP